MSNLSIENTITMDIVLSHQSTGIFAEIMENFDDFSVL